MKMTILRTYGRIFQIYIEFNIKFGATPIFLIEDFKNETIIHMPYIQIIYTPRNSIKGMRNGKRIRHSAGRITQTPKDKP